MHLRDATPADIPAITEIYNATIPGRMVTADTAPVTEESRHAWWRAHRDAARPVWVAEEAGAIVAWLSFDPFFPRPAYDGTAMIAVYVADLHRRRGYGRLLVEEAIRRAPALGLHTLLGYIFAHNEPSLRLFTSLGFSRWAHLPRVAVLDGTARDLIIVGRRVEA
ncbi:MAG: GNAT family N-acetyltransferase [Opitutales bacterium]